MTQARFPGTGLPGQRQSSPAGRMLASSCLGQGPAVVCLHGQPGSRADWAAVTELLSGEFTVVTLDRLGYGDTGGTAGGFAANAAAVIVTMDHLGIDEAIVVGHSWGGAVALALAGAHPHRVAGLVLVGSTGPGDEPAWTDRLVALPVVGEVLVASTFAGARALLTDPALRALLEKFRPGIGPALSTIGPSRWGGRTAPWRAFVIDQRAYLDELADLVPTLDRVTAPCVVVVGSADRVVSPAVGAHLAATLATATLRTVLGGGHLLALDHPDVVADAVRQVGFRSP